MHLYNGNPICLLVWDASLKFKSNTSMRELILVPNAIASPIDLTEGELYMNSNN